MASKSRHRWPSRRHRGDYSWRGIQGAGGFGRTIYIGEELDKDENVAISHSDVSISFPASFTGHFRGRGD